MKKPKRRQRRAAVPNGVLARVSGGQNHPYYVQMMSGLGTGLYTFDAAGDPVGDLPENE